MYDGGNWVTPTLEGKSWLEKPPLYYWITIPQYSLFKSSELAARIGPATCALVTALSIFWLGSIIGSRLAGFLGAIILLTSLGFAGFGRSASTDMPFSCCFTLAMTILAVAVKKDPGAKVLIGYIFLGLAVLGKGPVALILVLGIGLCFWLMDESGALLRRWKVIPGIIITLLVSIPWFWLAFRQNGYAFISTFFINHNFARFVTDIHHHSQPFYYFLPVLLALMFPWSGWLLLLVSESPLKGLRRWREWDPFTIFLVCWFLFPVLFFSLSDSKLAGYILPSFPPLALIVGIHLSRYSERIKEMPRLRSSMALHLGFSLLMSLAAPIYFNREQGGRWDIGLLISAVVLLPAITAFISGLKGHWIRAFIATAVQGVAVLVIVVLFAFPVLGTHLSCREIAHLALRVQQEGEPIASYRFFEHSLNYYTGYQIAGRLEDPQSLLRFTRENATSLIVTKSGSLNEISNNTDLSIAVLGKQADVRLLRIAQRH